ncbi:MAG: lauroyl acyltransferase [Alphaproteobacteria bacterium]|nr:lauroyl acyltransferase [Alphaproteobacteria bacterium]
MPPTRSLRHALEALGLLLFWALCRALPLDWASALGGWLARLIGPSLPVTGRARKNLRLSFPDLPATELARMVASMWDNLGRVAAEYPHLGRAVMAGRVELVGEAHLAALRDQARTTILVGGHLANWEILAIVARARAIPLAGVYRRPNNPLVDRLLRRARGDAAELLPKGSQGARGTIAVLGRGGNLGMLVDQKMNDGIAVPFFGRPAMTAPAAAELALRYGAAIVPARVERLRGARFRLTLHAPLAMPDATDRKAAVLSLMTRINGELEEWIRARPDQWLWLHRRWPD